MLLLFDRLFEDACEEVAAVPKTLTVSNNNNNNNGEVSPGGKSPKSKGLKFPKKLRKHKKKKRAEGEEIPLAEAIEEAKAAVDLFLNNQFNEAEDIVKPM